MILMAIVYRNVLSEEEVGFWGVLITILLVCLFSGIVTMSIGAMIGYLSVPPILAGLAVQKFVDGISLILTRGTAYSRFAGGLRAMDVYLIFGLPAGFYVIILAATMIAVVFHKKDFGGEYLHGWFQQSCVRILRNQCEEDTAVDLFYVGASVRTWLFFNGHAV